MKNNNSKINILSLLLLVGPQIVSAHESAESSTMMDTGFGMMGAGFGWFWWMWIIMILLLVLIVLAIRWFLIQSKTENKDNLNSANMEEEKKEENNNIKK